MKEMPTEVYEAILFECSGMTVGVDTMDRIIETRKKYPEYFPWYTLYNSIDERIHESYRKERESRRKLEKEKIGLWEKINKSTYEPGSLTLEMLTQVFSDLYGADIERKRKKEEERKKEKELWDEFYEPFGLEYK